LATLTWQWLQSVVHDNQKRGTEKEPSTNAQRGEKVHNTPLQLRLGAKHTDPKKRVKATLVGKTTGHNKERNLNEKPPPYSFGEKKGSKKKGQLQARVGG